MSILIKGMEMPPAGTGKVIMIDSDGDVWAAGRDECTIIDGAKAVHIPPHGRLFDFDALLDDAKKRMQDEGLSNEEISVNMEFLEWCFTNEHNRLYAPTVIPAEEDE